MHLPGIAKSSVKINVTQILQVPCVAGDPMTGDCTLGESPTVPLNSVYYQE